MKTCHSNTAPMIVAVILLVAGGSSANAAIITFGENTMAQADQIIFAGNSPVVGGVVVVTEFGVNPFPSGPNPILTVGLGGNSNNNFGISDILAFIPGINPGGGNELVGELASDNDRDATDPNDRLFADVNGVTLNGQPVQFANPKTVGIFEIWGPSGTVEYAPAVDQPGYFLDANGAPPVYLIGTDNSGNGSANIPPQTPTFSFLGGNFTVGGGSTPYLPEPSSLVLSGCGLALLLGYAGLMRRRVATCG
jgi:hypothetical protein